MIKAPTWAFVPGRGLVKGGLGKLRERPRGEGWRPGQPWRALSRPTWRTDIRAAVISRTRINLHRKIVKHAAFAGEYPVAILSDCVVYAADGPSPLDFLPYRNRLRHLTVALPPREARVLRQHYRDRHRRSCDAL